MTETPYDVDVTTERVLDRKFPRVILQQQQDEPEAAELKIMAWMAAGMFLLLSVIIWLFLRH